jgi:hypothetical protein
MNDLDGLSGPQTRSAAGGGLPTARGHSSEAETQRLLDPIGRRVGTARARNGKAPEMPMNSPSSRLPSLDRSSR